MKPKQFYKQIFTEQAQFHCSCNPSKSFICIDHISDYAKEGRIHPIPSIPGIDPEIKESIIHLLIEENLKTNQIKTESIKSFNKLLSSLESLLKKALKILDMNLHEIDAKLLKVSKAINVSELEDDQILQSLLTKSVSKNKEIFLFDRKIAKNMDSINIWISEIDTNFQKLIAYKTEDFARIDIKSIVRNFQAENLKYQRTQPTYEIEKWGNVIASWNQDFINYPTTRANWNFKYGLIEYLSGNLLEALSYFSFAIKLNPNYSDCYFYKGAVLASLNRKEESLECWNYLLQINNEFSFINLIKGEILHSFDLDKESLEAYDQFIQGKAERLCANTLKLESLIAEKKFIELKALAESLIKLNPNFGIGYTYKGWAFGGLNDNRALKWYFKAIDNDEYDFKAYNKIGDYLSLQNEYAKSLENYNMSISINPYYAESYLNKGMTLFDKKYYEEALVCFQEVIRLNSNVQGVYNLIGLIFLKKEEYEEAIKNFDIAIKIDPEDEVFRSNRNIAIEKLK